MPSGVSPSCLIRKRATGKNWHVSGNGWINFGGNSEVVAKYLAVSRQQIRFLRGAGLRHLWRFKNLPHVTVVTELWTQFLSVLQGFADVDDRLFAVRIQHQRIVGREQWVGDACKAGT